MKRGFYTILAAQFFSALADNVLLFAAIALLKLVSAPDWHTPLLQESFVISYIILAPFVGAFSDSLPKGRVMFISNAIKLGGCFAMLFGVNPLLAYGLAGFGAAAYSPAKYGILTEFLPPEKLVLANSWMEGLTVLAIILGAVLGGVLISPHIAGVMLQWCDVPLIETGIDTAPELAIAIVAGIYLLAGLFNLYIPALPIDHKPLSKDPSFLVKEFAHCFKLLWKDPLGQVSLGVTTLFWGTGATLRLIVLAWAAAALHYDIGQAAKLTAWVAVGIAIGSILAARYVKLGHAVNVLPVGVGMGVVVLLMPLVTTTPVAIVLLITIGAMGGFFVVPMNALLQHRGHLLMGAGSSIAVQNFNENLSIFVMLALYAAMEKMDFGINTIIIVFGILLSGIMAALYQKHGHDQDTGKI
ncbi:MAG: lysophospholipid transporter LplT [Gallionellaceae bacterium]|nr:MAG: lysophospholipid transporter LplT [Gallionellaceae bacterium]